MDLMNGRVKSCCSHAYCIVSGRKYISLKAIGGGLLFFFFSSRRRHTRSYGDWSSDVCSSDLVQAIGADRDERAARVGIVAEQRAICEAAAGKVAVGDDESRVGENDEIDPEGMRRVIDDGCG